MVIIPLVVTVHFSHVCWLLQVLGPLSDNIAAMFGNYAPQVQERYSASPLDGLRKLADIVDFVRGCNDVLCSEYDSVAVGIAAALADTVVVCLGNGKPTVINIDHNTGIV